MSAFKVKGSLAFDSASPRSQLIGCQMCAITDYFYVVYFLTQQLFKDKNLQFMKKMDKWQKPVVCKNFWLGYNHTKYIITIYSVPSHV